MGGKRLHDCIPTGEWATREGASGRKGGREGGRGRGSWKGRVTILKSGGQEEMKRGREGGKRPTVV